MSWFAPLDQLYSHAKLIPNAATHAIRMTAALALDAVNVTPSHWVHKMWFIDFSPPNAMMNIERNNILDVIVYIIAARLIYSVAGDYQQAKCM